MLTICVCCGTWSAPGAVNACCTWHMSWLYVCIVVLGAQLWLSMSLLYVEWDGPDAGEWPL